MRWAISGFLFLAASAAAAQEPASCKTVRMAEPGWNDLTLTTAIGATLLNALGYEAKSSVLGVNVIYQGLKNRQLDAFLGYWDPAMVTYYAPFKADGSVENVVTNLTGAKYTFAVPSYVADAGVKDLKDLSKFADKFGHKMYGIEAGSNQLMIDAINDPSFDLKGWNVVESSEQGMLAEVQRSIAAKKFIVFQGWAPHPMNTKFKMTYLTGGDKFFGPNFGAATVSTQVRKGYLQECPNVAQLLKNLVFDIEFENSGMGYLIDDHMSPGDAAKHAIAAQPGLLDKWLGGVTTSSGEPGREAVRKALKL
jgi:glycine betaine/proline transport system substrate-binding protein